MALRSFTESQQSKSRKQLLHQSGVLYIIFSINISFLGSGIAALNCKK